MDSLITPLVAIALLWLLSGSLLLWLRFGTQIRALWREPVLRYPVMIFESDDWGAGPDCQVSALAAISKTLTRYKDADGRHPVMTLAMVLAEPDFKRINGDPDGRYFPKLINHDDDQALLSMVQQGVSSGVFSLHLHGLEHYWPDALMSAAQHRQEVADWFASEQPVTEQLPSELQSRWTHGAELPSRPLAIDRIRQTVRHEVDAFQSIFGIPPNVVVPPTFVWNELVEWQWAECGVEVIVTPGQRFVSRNESGLSADKTSILAGQPGADGVTYMVRDAYFEPSWGHPPEQAVEALAEHTALGRATLFETHRFNFLNDLTGSISALEQLIELALKRFPDLRFISTEELALRIRVNDKQWLVDNRWVRLNCLLRRIQQVPGFRRWSLLTGSWLLVIAVRSILNRASVDLSPNNPPMPLGERRGEGQK